MKKLCILIVVLLMMSSFASAGFWDLITGKVIDAEKINLDLCTPKITPDATTAALGKNVFVQDYNAFSGNGRTVLPAGQVLVGVSTTFLYEMEGQEIMSVGQTKQISGLNIKVTEIYTPARAGARRCAKLEVSRAVAAIAAVEREVVAQAQPAMAIKTPAVAVKQPSLIARLFGAKTVAAKPAATSTVEVAVPARSVAAPSESPEVEASLPAASAEAMTTPKCKTFMASELSYNPDHITGNQICTKNDFGQCMVVLSETTTSYSYDKFNVGLQTHWSRLVNCDEDLISWSGEWEELKSPWNMFDKPVYVRDNNHSPAGGSVLCCK